MKIINLLLVIMLTSLLVSSCEKAFEYDKSEIPSDFEGLTIPTLEEGYQIHVPPFPVPSQFEREWFLRMDIGNTEDIYVSSFESKCRPGTHHLIAYGFENENAEGLPEVGVMRDQNRADGRPNFTTSMGGDLAYFISQEADFKLDLPEGTAVKIPANASVDMNSHYFNRTDRTLFGEVYLNFYTETEENVEEVLYIESVDNDELLELPPGETTIIDYTDMFEQDRNIRMLVSHMHKRGVLFNVYLVGGDRDGEQIYSAWDYQHPPTMSFEDEPLLIKAGEGIRTEVTYINDTNRTIQYGVTSEDEMGILFYMYSQPK